MHILLLNEYYPPDTSATAKIAAEVAETLARSHKVTVVAGRPSYDPDEFYPWKFLRTDTRNGVTVERVGSTAYPRHQMRRRVANYLSYLTLAVPRAFTIRPDLVLAMTDPPIVGIAGAFVARLMRRPFVYNIRDLYPDMAVGGAIVRRSWWVRQWERRHRWTLNHAARVIVLGNDMRERILRNGVRPERVVIVRDGTTATNGTAPPTSVRDPATQHAEQHAAQQIVDEIRGGFPFVVLHAGNLGFYGAWTTLLEAAKILRDKNIGFVFVGSGANRAALEAAAAGSPNVRFLPFRPANELPCVMMAGDLHVITVKRGLEGVVVPSKLYSTLAAGRPVLAVAPESCDVPRIVEQAGCGFAADPDDPQSVASAILDAASDRPRLDEMGVRASRIAPNYARVNELARFVQVIDEAARER
jgi:glycosyltransferase involved in cell wall biosynthesis